MSKPQTKVELLSEGQKEHLALDEILASLGPDQMLQGGVAGEWTVKDLLAHVFEWEQMVLAWLAAGERGEKPCVPAEGYKWSQLPALNEAIRQKHLDRQLDDVLERYRGSYLQITEKMESLSEEALFAAGLYPWMNKNRLAAYFTSCTSSHYRWARAEIKQWLKGRK